MTREEFKKLQVGDQVTHPAFNETLTIVRIETSYDYTTRPPTPWTDAITVHTRDRLKIGDTRDVMLLEKVS
ncbi:MAG: hypothetical protein L0332_24700 [Chloroflexi bacterium]|nr:hypothetical protein [Chloroflexota bacterium]MCI0644569.1 hypothetical protein [Chloroflexota bacterium]MCI0729896.1 hypothetical protein [Chloroflexota bacterium]